LHTAASVFGQARFVYVLRSRIDATRYYTGVTSNVARRLAVHNTGGSKCTAHLRPWALVVSLEFANEESALAFERYLKSGSGRAFAKKHFV
jgi:putative endonuclease